MSDPTTDFDALIKSELLNKLGIPSENIIIERNNVGTNNYVQMITLSQPIDEPVTKATHAQVMTQPVPKGTTRLVFRIPRAESSLEDSIRVRNEVSLLTMARAALADVDPSLVPRVYGWNDANIEGATASTTANPSYIIEEFIGGDVLTRDDINAFDEETRATFLGQVARVIKAFQAYELPEGVTGYGGVTFDDAGTMKSTKCVIPMGGPFRSYKDFIRATIDWQLKASDNVPELNGWRDDKSEDGQSLRERIDNLIANGLNELFEKVPEHKPVLIHGDFNPPNLHFDRSTNRLTGILDFDFGHVSHPLSEPLFSFGYFQGFLPGLSMPGKERDLLLSGYNDGDDGDAKYAVGRAWEAALAAEGAVRPSQVENAELVSDLWWFGQDLCQPYWLIPRVLAGLRAEGKEASMREETVGDLKKCLDHWGY